MFRSVIVLSASVLALAWAAQPAVAATIFLEPSTTSVASGSQFDVAVLGTGFDRGTDGGDFWLEWSPNLSFVDFTVANPPWDFSDVDTSEAMNIGSYSHLTGDVGAFFDTPGLGGAEFTIGTLRLAALAASSSEYVAVYANDPSLGWSSGGDFVADVQYAGQTGINVIATPLPASVWLLASGLLFPLLRRAPGKPLARTAGWGDFRVYFPPLNRAGRSHERTEFGLSGPAGSPDCLVGTALLRRNGVAFRHRGHYWLRAALCGNRSGPDAPSASGRASARRRDGVMG